ELDLHRRDRHADRDRAGGARGLRAVAARLPGQEADPFRFARRGAGPAGAVARVCPPISIVGSLFDIWRAIGLYDTWAGLIIPYMTFTLPLAIYTLPAFFREVPWGLH